jgi:hypothetical protein
MDFDFILTTPYVIIVLCLMLIHVLTKIGKFTGRRDVTNPLSLMPVVYVVVFLWVIIETPSAQVSQPILRSVLMFCMGCSLFIAISFFNNIDKKRL